MLVKKKYKHIFFDLDNTLWDFERNSEVAMKSAFDIFEIEKQNIKFDDFFAVYAGYNHNLWEQYRKNEVTKNELIQKRFQLTFKDLEILGIEPETINSCYLDEMPKQKHLNEGVLEILQYLKKKNYKLYIITNGFKEVQHKKLLNSGISSFFTKVFISEDIKTAKPGYQIFEYAIKSANAKKAESLMVGDDWEADVLGAAGFGIDSVFYSPKTVLNAGRDCFLENRIIIYKISKFSQIVGVL